MLSVPRSHYLSEESFVALQRQAHDEAPTTPLHALVSQQCSVVYRRGSAQQQLRAALRQVTHLALSDRFAAARDLLLMARLQERALNADVATGVLLNRAMAQLGLAAFRAGAMVTAHNCLDELVNVGTRNGVLRVLLGQGSDAMHEQRAGEEELRVLEERCVLPAHMVGERRGDDAVDQLRVRGGLLPAVVLLHGPCVHARRRRLESVFPRS